MKLLIITNIIHKKNDDQYFGYGPYVKEMNLWLKHVDKVDVIAPVILSSPNPIDLAYTHSNLKLVKVDPICFTSIKASVISLIKLPVIFFKVIKQTSKADHIHLRCPGNMGLVGCIAQMFFPHKIKTAKYAANWDPKSKQPLSYRIQQSLIRNTTLTKNMTGLVYGVWPNHTKNIKPFFTASYTKKDDQVFKGKVLQEPIELMFVGMLAAGKQPMLSAKVCYELNCRGINAILNLYGEGNERENLEKFIQEKKLEEKIFLHGNQSQLVLQKAYQKSHFLIFLSKSEGWPKAVAEAMWWGCLPVTTSVSCVPEMVGYGERGDVINASVKNVCDVISNYLKEQDLYNKKCMNAANWARKYTLEMFEAEIKKIISN